MSFTSRRAALGTGLAAMAAGSTSSSPSTFAARECSRYHRFPMCLCQAAQKSSTAISGSSPLARWRMETSSLSSHPTNPKSDLSIERTSQTPMHPLRRRSCGTSVIRRCLS